MEDDGMDCGVYYSVDWPRILLTPPFFPLLINHPFVGSRSKYSLSEGGRFNSHGTMEKLSIMKCLCPHKWQDRSLENTRGESRPSKFPIYILTNRPPSNESSLHPHAFIELEWTIVLLYIFILFRRLDEIVAGTGLEMDRHTILPKRAR